jgi:hypothetical protein
VTSTKWLGSRTPRRLGAASCSEGRIREMSSLDIAGSKRPASPSATVVHRTRLFGRRTGGHVFILNHQGDGPSDERASRKLVLDGVLSSGSGVSAW